MVSKFVLIKYTDFKELFTNVRRVDNKVTGVLKRRNEKLERQVKNKKAKKRLCIPAAEKEIEKKSSASGEVKESCPESGKDIDQQSESDESRTSEISSSDFSSDSG
jgi:hypothetical protein